MEAGLVASQQYGGSRTYGNDSGMVTGLSIKCNKLIKAIEEAVREMDQNGYSPEVRRRLIEAVEKARPKGKDQ